jgi:GntR family transcriptional regulator
MQFRIDVDNGMPIYEQLVRQIKYAIAEGTVVPGQLVPSVRELSKSLAINPNTVQRAYQQLQQEEIVETLRGRGVAVCTGAKQRCNSDRQRLLVDRLGAVLAEALHSGLDDQQCHDLFSKALQNAKRSNRQSRT